MKEKIDYLVSCGGFASFICACSQIINNSISSCDTSKSFLYYALGINIACLITKFYVLPKVQIK